MSTSEANASNSNTLPTELKAEQALGLIGLGLMQKMSREGTSGWDWSTEGGNEKVDIASLRHRLELTALAIDTGAPLSTSEVTHLLGSRPGSSKTERGGLVARRISRNVWRLNKAEQENSHWRN
tara:strand:+ start:231 stop:602 length:372 start_codon:yes stop_codon:yes gene_type:complete